MRPEATALIGIDWGTSRLRAFQIGTDGQILDRRHNDRGIAGLCAGDFDPALRELVAGWPTGIPILMCGMVGSRQGWREVAYQQCPAGTRELAQRLFPLATGAGPAWIVPGLATREDHPMSRSQPSRMIHDVMRGEETLIVGAELPLGVRLVIAPGTHSKWAMVHGGTIEHFRTSMTGEMYALLREHSLLGRFMPADHEGGFDQSAFLDGVQLGLDEPALLHSLFSVRTQALFEQRPHAALAAYLSGILIGSEVSAEARHIGKVDSTILIAGPELGHRYQLALAAGGFADVRHVDAAAAAAKGLWNLWQLRGAAS